MIGRISFYNSTKGYGFIVTVPKSLEGPSQEKFFFHFTNFKDGETPAPGVYVVFGLAPGIEAGKKPQAVGIRFATEQEVGLAALAIGGAL